MTTNVDLSDEQARVAAHHGSLYAKACPGAGKTRALVARAQILAKDLPPTRGLALLSFTNSAADEFRERLVKAGASSLLRPPHFVGTIDSFLGRYVVSPRGNPFAPEQPIQHVDGWQPYTVRVFTGQRTKKGSLDQRPVKLSAFQVSDIDLATGSVKAQLDFGLLAREHGRGLATHLEGLSLQRREKAESTAAKTLRSLMTRGLLSPAEVRLLAAEFLMAGDEPARAHLRNLVSRFPQVVVDEAQDCDTAVLALLEQLSKTGSGLTLVADPDQCIYTWRGADPRGLTRLSKQWEVSMKLTGNFRSSPNICHAASSLKAAPVVDRARGRNKSCGWPIYVAPLKSGKPFLVGQLFVKLLSKHVVDQAKAVVLAPSWSLARAVAGAESPKSKRQQLGGKLREACYVARQSPDERSIIRIRDLVQRHLDKRSPDLTAENLDLTQTQHLKIEARRLSYELLAANPVDKNWHGQAVDVLDTFRPPNGIVLQSEAGKCLPRPSKPFEIETEPVSKLAFSSVHQAKGREFEAVLFAAGRQVNGKWQAFLSEWKARKVGSESRAVAYVAVSRAERLLLVSVPQKECDQVLQLLRRDGATVELLAPILS